MTPSFNKLSMQKLSMNVKTSERKFIEEQGIYIISNYFLIKLTLQKKK